MSERIPLTIGLFGFGVVGEGIFQVLQNTPSLNAHIRKICIRHPEKERAADPALFTTNADELLDDPEINLIVELIDRADDAYAIVTKALRSGKSVVSANKKMIAEHLSELLWLQRQADVSFLYEAAVCGSIPILRNLEEYYDNDLLQRISGIVNGSTNYILTRVGAGLGYGAALAEAQVAGFAESDPRLDVEGFDAANKLTLLLAHAYGMITDPANLLRMGIHRLQDGDSAYAHEKGYRIRLNAQACKLRDGKVAAFVLPQFVRPESQLYRVDNEYNGVELESSLADRQFLYGKGAGRFPTASAVISDISALRYGYRYEYKKLRGSDRPTLSGDYFLQVYVSFKEWAEVSKWDFEQVLEYHGSDSRQYLTGIIHVEKLRRADWFEDPAVSIVLLPDGVVEKETLLERSLRKLSRQLAGSN